MTSGSAFTVLCGGVTGETEAAPNPIQAPVTDARTKITALRCVLRRRRDLRECWTGR
jgi:hypothetical protein